MRNTEQAILNVFKDNPSKELDTSELAKSIFPQDYIQIEALMDSHDKATINEGKRKKFQIHRKLLYYLNKLVDEHILKIARIQEKGEKIFTLAIEEGDITFEKGYKKIMITKSNLPSNYIEHYESSGIMKKFDNDTWINRFNSILIECSKASSIEKLYSLITQCIGNVNDVIALNDFEIILNNNEPDQVQNFLEKIHEDTTNFDKTISIILNINEASNVKEFIDDFVAINPKKMNIVLGLNNKELQKNSDIISYIVEKFSEVKIKLNIKNKEVCNAPHFKGRSGIYNFDDDEWKLYQKDIKDKVFGIACSQCAIAVNINKFFETYKTDKEFREALINASKVMLLANAIQRRKSNEYFRNINVINGADSSEFYKLSRNYIRFWNYDWHKDIEEKSNLFELLKSTKEVVDNFCYTEETIFKSCGLPIRFRVAFSSAFRNFDPVFMGEREYKKATVKATEDLYKGEIKNFLEVREKMFKVFDGGDRSRIFRSTDFKASDIIHEFSIIMSSFKIPFFTYDFSGLRGMVKLTNFM